MDKKLVSKYFKTHGLHVAMTFCLLLVAFIENYYINCIECTRQLSCINNYSPLWCAFGWVYLVLGFVLLSIARYYRKLANKPKRSD